MFLSKLQIKSFSRLGFTVLENFASLKEVNNLKAAANNICQTTPIEEINGFFTSNAQKIESRNNDYFLNSADKVRIFLEEGVKKEDINNQNLMNKINKIGHGLHLHNPAFRDFINNHKIKNISRDLKMTNPVVAQSMYIVKPPNIGGEVKPHQDNSYLYTYPPSCLGFWLPLDDATIDNGCLWVYPGSHSFPLDNRFLFFKETGKLHYQPDVDIKYLNQVWDPSQFVPLELKAGSLLVFHGNLVHKSDANYSDKSRHAFTFHLISGNSSWSCRNWLQYPEDKSFMELMG